MAVGKNIVILRNQNYKDLTICFRNDHCLGNAASF